MTKRLLMVLLTIGLLAAMAPGTALAGDKTVDYGWGPGPNQGDMSKVIPLRNYGVNCCTPVPSHKYEGDFGTYKWVYAYAPIYGVTVKSGKNADFDLYVKGWHNGKYWVKIYGDKDISNFVVWTCPCGANGAG
jgi:hypothetical protein